MCLCLYHDSENCPAAKAGHIKNCLMKDKNGIVCGKLHCGFLCTHRKSKNFPSKDRKPFFRKQEVNNTNKTSIEKQK